MELTLVRHGESSGNAGLGFEGPEPHLTERGRRQARYAAEHLRGEGETYDALYTSCMSRALETACAVADAVGLQPRVWIPLAEHRELPDFRGCPRSVLEGRYPGVALPEECTEEGWWHHGPEDEAALYARARRAAEDLRSHHEETGHRILVVTHGGFGSALLDVLLGLPPCGYQRFEQRNCAFGRILLAPDFTRLRFWNSTSHLPPHEIT
jgi:broad specificity phosphatase PhoE